MFWCLVGRAVSVPLLSCLVNRCRKEHRQIPRNHQALMWHAGLRGAIAFSLSINFPSQNKETIVSATMWIIVFTIFAFGGSTSWVLRKLQIQTGVAKEEGEEASYRKQEEFKANCPGAMIALN